MALIKSGLELQLARYQNFLDTYKKTQKILREDVLVLASALGAIPAEIQEFPLLIARGSVIQQKLAAFNTRLDILAKMKQVKLEKIRMLILLSGAFRPKSEK